MNAIENKVKWLEDAHSNPHWTTGEIVSKRVQAALAEIDAIDKFVNLKENASIQGYWNPIIKSWRERIEAARS
jgi:hypothetical protein